MSEYEDIELSKKETSNVPVETKRGELLTNEKGQLIGTDFEGQWKMAKAAIDSGMVPKSYKKPSQVLMGLQYAAGIGLAPTIASLTNIAVINGQPSIWGELPLKLARESGELEHFDEYLIDKDYKKICVENQNLEAEIFAAVCEIKRKGYEKKTFHWTVAQQQKSKGGVADIWKQYFPIMLKRKCRSIALKDEFGDVLGPISIAEYDHHTMPDYRDVSPKTKAASDFKEMFNKDETNEEPE